MAPLSSIPLMLR
ncbi:unnamed protein product [Linum tenue]|uniref:Uncharacterized protein n=1 Tax=Linum tenue TaxID=586396 RepID=A0AAV0IW90_9ROSI|nr:unnamed protein product [Linum tenue]